VGDFTACSRRGAVADAQRRSRAGRCSRWTPPDRRATIGGIVATGDSGPLRHRYGGVRDLVVGDHVALSDGTLAKAGGKVIKNVAGYDLASCSPARSGRSG
jgi:glycolate oxidase FAD binding subunit